MLQAGSIAESLKADAPRVRSSVDAAWILRLPAPIATNTIGPLAGMSFAVKDNIDVAGLPTTAACPTFAYSPDNHAAVVERLLAAGALLVGKTNMDQFACGLNGTRSPYGAVSNAFDPAYISGGSSSGSAVAVARGEVDFALGTDTAGSGRVPAGLNNIVGLKPSKGLISTSGVVPAMGSVDCVSIFAGTVAIAARVLEVALAYDAANPYSRRIQLETAPFPSAFRFGVPDQLEFFGDSQSEAAFEKAIALLRSLGGTPVTINYAPLAAAAELLYGSALLSERYAAIHEFFDANEAAVIEPVRSILAAGRNYSGAELIEAQLQLREFSQRAQPMWDEMEVLMVPTAPTHYTIEAVQADPITLNRNLGTYTNFVNLLDYAAIAIPGSFRRDELPFGVTFVGQRGSDWQLAELGQRFHHATGLPLGATGEALPPSQSIAGITPRPTVKVAVVGAHLSGMPLNSQLTERGATLVQTTETSADYRLFSLPGTSPPKPGLVRVPAGTGARIALEVWDLPLEHFGSFVAMIPAPLGIGTLQLADGSTVQGFVCETLATVDALDISHFGGWRAYSASLAKS